MMLFSAFQVIDFVAAHLIGLAPPLCSRFLVVFAAVLAPPHRTSFATEFFVAGERRSPGAARPV